VFLKLYLRSNPTIPTETKAERHPSLQSHRPIEM
jgi:hypothetical protein